MRIPRLRVTLGIVTLFTLIFATGAATETVPNYRRSIVSTTTHATTIKSTSTCTTSSISKSLPTTKTTSSKTPNTTSKETSTTTTCSSKRPSSSSSKTSTTTKTSKNLSTKSASKSSSTTKSTQTTTRASSTTTTTSTLTTTSPSCSPSSPFYLLASNVEGTIDQGRYAFSSDTGDNDIVTFVPTIANANTFSINAAGQLLNYLCGIANIDVGATQETLFFSTPGSIASVPAIAATCDIASGTLRCVDQAATILYVCANQLQLQIGVAVPAESTATGPCFAITLTVIPG